MKIQFRAALLLLIMTAMVFSQSPTHRRILFEGNLTEEFENEYAKIENYNGLFVNRGWQATKPGIETGSKLIVTIKNRLPQSATIEWKVRNFDPFTQTDFSKQHIAFFTGSEDRDNMFYDEGSWFYLRTGENYCSADGSCSMKLDVGSRGLDTRQEHHILAGKKWNPGDTYYFKVVYDSYYMWFYLNDVLIKTEEFTGQIKRFNQIYIGGDPDYPTIVGPIYSDLKILTTNEEMFFIDRTYSKNVAGLGTPDFAGHGLAVGDVNGDGLPDIYVGNCVRDKCLRDILYIQQPDGTYLDETEKRGVADECCSHGVVFFDADNDGDLDLFNANTWEPNQLYINDGSGYFSEESFDRGLEAIDGETRGAVVFDVNNDGYMDIYAVNWGSQNEMYINDGTGFFNREYRGAEGAVEDPEVIGTQGVTVSDIDNDGDYDIYVSKREKANELYINDNGQFREAAAERGADIGRRSDGATFADIDNDGDMDLFVANTRQPNFQEKMLLHVLINNGRGYFTNKTNEYDLGMDGFTPQFFDADNNGTIDLYRLRNNDYDKSSVAVLSLNDGTGKFVSAGYCGATVIGADARGCAVHDFDQDGDIDIYISNKLFDNIYLENRSQQFNNYIDILTYGPQGDAGGIGSKIDVYLSGYLGSPSGLLSHREVTSVVGYLSGSGLVQHFGLGNHSSCDVRVTLVNGSVLEQRNAPANQLLKMGNAAEWKQINYVSGNEQTGPINQILPMPFVVSVSNQDGMNEGQVPVQFELVEGAGKCSGDSLVYTNSAGLASVTYQLGHTLQAVKVHARVEGARNNPVEFVAYPQKPEYSLSKLSGDNQTSAVNSLLPEDISVQVLNNSGVPAANIDVLFTVSSGGGNIESLTSKSIKSDDQGTASVKWTLGSTIGEQKLVVQVAETSVEFTAFAVAGQAFQIVKISGDEQNLVPGVAFQNPFIAKITDSAGNGISNFQVKYFVDAGNGHINGVQEINVYTDQNGTAAVVWTPDEYLGPENILKASASINSNPLANSPVSWSYPGIDISSSHSTVTASGPVLANGTQKSNIVVNLKDSQNNNVGAGVTVDIAATGSENQLTITNAKTDENGQVFATLASTKAETKEISALVLGLNLQLEQKVSVVFQQEDLIPDQIIYNSGNNQSGVVAKPLPQPFEVKIVDQADKAVRDYDVQFVVTGGGGTISGESIKIVKTNSDGIASVILTLGKIAGIENTVEARAPDLKNTPVYFKAMSQPDQARLIVLHSGNNQQGYPGEVLTHPLEVKITDIFNNIISDYTVQYNVNLGDCSFSGLKNVTVKTDTNGIARVYVTLGQQQGQSLVEAKTDFASVTFTITTLSPRQKPNAQLSSITATSPVLPDGQSQSFITVTVRDDKANTIPGIKINIIAIGESVVLTIPDSTTNSAGQVNAYLTSTVEGQKTIMAYILPDNVLISQQAKVIFTLGTADISIFSGDKQVGIVGKKLPAPFSAIMFSNGAALANQKVTFTVQKGEGHFNGLHSAEVITSSNGIAQIEYYLGSLAGENIVKAVANSLPENPLYFSATGLPDIASKLTKIAGDSQSVRTNTELPQKLIVGAKDVYNNRVPKTQVTFVALDGGHVLTPQPVLTDSFGLAETTVALGDRPGSYTFKAVLNSGALTLFNATALNINSPPLVTSYLPEENNLTVSYGQRIQFKINKVLDADNDPISFQWLLNGKNAGTDEEFLLFMSSAFPTENSITCLISDGRDITSVKWTLKVVATAVELITFTGHYLENQGIQLSWKIGALNGNAGYNVWRSLEKDKDYKKINTDIISSSQSSSSEYQFIDQDILQPGTLYYKLEDISTSGQITWHEPVTVTIAAPSEFALLQNFPNPFNPSTSISFKVPKNQQIRLEIYNFNGQSIKTLIDGNITAGFHTVIWNATDYDDRAVPSGIYFCKMTANGFVESRKLTLMK